MTIFISFSVITLAVICEVALNQPLGSFSTDDGNVTLKMSSRFFKLFLVYYNSLEMSKVGEFPWS